MIDDETARSLVNFLLGGGALGLIAGIGRVLYKWRTGRISEERIRNTGIVNQRLEAIEERNIADRNSRRLAADNGRLRGLLLKNGIEPGDEIILEEVVAASSPVTKSARRQQRGSTE